jgi:hypothetical protein
VLRKVITKALPPISWLNRAVPRDLESVVHKATAKDPDDRYSSALALAADLENVLGNKPVVARYYRYKFDEREIAAERPREIIYLSFLFMFIALTILGSCIMFFMAEIEFQRAVPIIAVIYSIVSIPFLVSSWYILTGRRWARLLTAIICSIISLSLWSSLVSIIYRNPQFLSVHLWYILLILCGIAISSLPVILALLLYRRRIQSWFAFSEQLRSEHKQEASRR